MKQTYQYLPNTMFGDLKLLSDKGLVKQKNNLNIHMVEIECFCGNTFITRITGIKNGRVKSCGCINRDRNRLRFTTHDLSNSITYESWTEMKRRCDNPNTKFYKNYGGRGISYCEEWKIFENFYKDMGDRPDKKHSLDRINNNGNYEPSNCKWSDKFFQNRNMRSNVYIEYDGETFVLCDLAKKVNMHQQTLKARILRGLPIEEAIVKSFKYIKSGKYKKQDGVLL